MASIFKSSIGKKLIMSISGLFLILFLIRICIIIRRRNKPSAIGSFQGHIDTHTITNSPQ